MTKWEYQVMRLQGESPGLLEQLEDQLDTQGGMGWELVTVMGVPRDRLTVYLAIFKRPSED